MTDDEQTAADAAQMLRAHQQLYQVLTDVEAATKQGEQTEQHAALSSAADVPIKAA